MDELKNLIDTLTNMMNDLLEDLPRAHKMVAPARRVRIKSVKLAKAFKDYRKLSCKIGLK